MSFTFLASNNHELELFGGKKNSRKFQKTKLELCSIYTALAAIHIVFALY